MPTLDEYLAMMQPKEPSQREKLMSMIGNLGVGLLSAPTWQKGLARGGLLAYDAQQGAKDRSAADKMAMLQQYKVAQGMADADSQREKQTRMDQAAQSSFIPGSPGSPEMGPPTAQGDMQPAVAPTAPGYDMNKYLSSMNAIDPARAMQIHQAMRPAATESPWAKINPKEYTPASLAAFSRSKNPADLVPIVAPEKADTPFGKVNPAEFTPGSLKQFIAGGMKDYSVLRKAQPVGGGAGASPPTTDKPLTESQATAALYYGMMQSASKDIASVDPKKINSFSLSAARGEIPYVPSALQNAAANPDAQKYTQAALQWTEAMLRATTGATAPPEEVARTAKTFFPQVGDKPENIKQKNDRRADMEKLMAVKAGATGARQAGDALGAPSPQSVKSQDEYDKLPSGAEYTAPDGSRRRKK